LVILNQKRKGLYQVAAAADRVVAGVAVPRGAKVTQVQGHIDIMSSARLAIDSVVNYALRGFMVPVHDFDTQITYDQIWDNLVPKDDSATDTIDADEDAGDTTAIDTPGLPDLETIMGIHGTKLMSTYKKQVEMSYASNPQFTHLDVITPFTDTFFWPSNRHSIKLNRGYVAQEPSLFLLAVSNPASTATTTALHSSPTITEWSRMSVLEYTLQQMMINFIGATEAGATTPYVEAQALIVKLMEPSSIEEASVAGHFVDPVLQASVSLNFKVDYPEKRLGGELSSSA